MAFSFAVINASLHILCKIITNDGKRIANNGKVRIDCHI